MRRGAGGAAVAKGARESHIIGDKLITETLL